MLERDQRGRFVKGMVPAHKKEHIIKTCPECGTVFDVHPCEDRIVCCSQSCGQRRRYRTKPHPQLGRTPSDETRQKLRLAKLGNGGSTHWNWKHGKRRDRNARWWRDAVFERDDYTCQVCRRRGVELHAHHVKRFVDNPSERHEVSNGLTLCVSCHHLVHARKVQVV